jgi:tetratricopeptide (TPR) repeat protein
MAKKIKLTRKQIKQRDEFLTMTDRALEYLMNHMNGAIAILVMIIVALILGFGVRYWMRTRQEEASKELTAALSVLGQPLSRDLTDEQILAGVKSFVTEEERAGEAVRKLEEMVNSYRGSKAAEEAHYYLASLYYHLQNYPRSLDHYNEYLKISSGSGKNRDPLFKSLIYFNQACCYFNIGNYEDALELYRKVIENKDSANRAESLVNAARCEEEMNNLDAAIAYLEKAWNEYPGAYSVRGIMDKIKTLQVKITQESQKELEE